MTGTGQGAILVINAGSSSIKYALFDGRLNKAFSGQVDISTKAGTGVSDHATALAQIVEDLAQNGTPITSLSAAVHRVVHGGATLTEPTRITPAVLAQIHACTPLAPLHNPHNTRAIVKIAEIAPNLPQFASFDTAFHSTNPDVATRYAVPIDWHKANIRRFGFHGISYQALVANFPGRTPEKLLAFHLGNGASICAILNGKSVATTMGYSPLEGLTMGTRSGSIDAAAVLRMAQESDPETTLETLNNMSGLYALSGGISDMKELTETNTPATRFAIEHFCYWAARHAGSMIAAMGGVDAIAFTGGIGENATEIRTSITNMLDWAGVKSANIHIIPAAEERQIAQNALYLLRDSDAD